MQFILRAVMIAFTPHFMVGPTNVRVCGFAGQKRALFYASALVAGGCCWLGSADLGRHDGFPGVVFVVSANSEVGWDTDPSLSLPFSHIPVYEPQIPDNFDIGDDLGLFQISESRTTETQAPWEQSSAPEYSVQNPSAPAPPPWHAPAPSIAISNYSGDSLQYQHVPGPSAYAGGQRGFAGGMPAGTNQFAQHVDRPPGHSPSLHRNTAGPVHENTPYNGFGGGYYVGNDSIEYSRKPFGPLVTQQQQQQQQQQIPQHQQLGKRSRSRSRSGAPKSRSAPNKRHNKAKPSASKGPANSHKMPGNWNFGKSPQAQRQPQHLQQQRGRAMNYAPPPLVPPPRSVKRVVSYRLVSRFVPKGPQASVGFAGGDQVQPEVPTKKARRKTAIKIAVGVTTVLACAALISLPILYAYRSANSQEAPVDEQALEETGRDAPAEEPNDAVQAGDNKKGTKKKRKWRSTSKTNTAQDKPKTDTAHPGENMTDCDDSERDDNPNITSRIKESAVRKLSVARGAMRRNEKNQKPDELENTPDPGKSIQPPVLPQ
eukprot:GHVT01065037.1.p1 GENE.GHVT01065037.1~~GHVT01065037.1.p1  ORF type:complete len:542 (+),score=83.53 GHVT01065037.1:323-1948(+)